MAEQNKNADMLTIIQTIGQIVSHAYDGSGADIGLRRDEEYGILDKRMIDGFKVRFSGNKMILTYHSQITISELHDKKFENKIQGIFSDIVKFIKKEYKSLQKKSVGIKSLEDAKIRVEYMNRVRSWVIAEKSYELTGIDEIEEFDEKQEKLLRDSINENIQNKFKELLKG